MTDRAQCRRELKKQLVRLGFSLFMVIALSAVLLSTKAFASSYSILNIAVERASARADELVMMETEI